MSAARPLVQVHSIAKDAKDAKANLSLPKVFLAPIRPDIVHDVHTSMNKNRRQAYGVNEMSGMQHSAESWGTGRAVARIPRVSGGGNSRSGQGAFGNMCRKGRMFAPTKIWRKWHRKINTNQKRYAVASAIAASALPSLVLARGHKIEQVSEIPLVVDNALQSIVKTKDAVKAFEALGAAADVDKARDSRKIRAGVGKSRNRRHVMRRGPLVVYAEDHGVTKAFRNLPGVEIANVDSLNLLQLAPGGHLGRFIIWTRGAFEKLHSLWGSADRESATKKGYHLPRSLMTNSDLTRIINSDEVQSKLRPAERAVRRFHLKKNPLKNLGALVKLNPYALAARRSEVLAQERRKASKAKALEAARAKKPVPLTREEQKAAARDRSHEPQQRLNYLRLSADEVKAAKPLKFKLQKSRPKQDAPAALSAEALKKKSESRKAKRAAKPKLEKKDAKAEAKEEKKLTRGQVVLAQLLKSQAMQKVAKKKSAGGGGGKAAKGGKGEKGKEAAKGEKGKEAAKGGEKGKEAAKGADPKKAAGGKK